MIVVPAPDAAADPAALAGRALPCCFSSPDRDGTARQFFASDPVQVVRGGAGALGALDAAWAEARRDWARVGAPAPAGTPVAAGYLAYDLGRGFHGLPPAPAGDWPELEVRFYDAFFVQRGGVREIWARDAAAAMALQARLHSSGEPTFTLSPFVACEPAAHHRAGVARVLQYLHAGDAYQVNLARRLQATLQADGPPGFALYTRLGRLAPAPHAFWFADPAQGRALCGNSPERFLHLSPERWLSTEPIKGTRGRGADAAADVALIAALSTDAKDRAEHVMIVDLERNDLGRVCETGSVEVVDLMRVLTLPSVHHLVSTVRGRLRADVTLPALIAATFPGGSITGAPKRRAMQIIDELEAAPRGPYTGATGWLGAAGDLDLGIAIRTALVGPRALTLWVGGGIVVDSSPEDELHETEVKAQAFAALAK